MRDFEEEYKKYIDEETPDLWNRIESQLEDRETTDINLSDRAKDRKISNKTVAKTTNKKIYPMIKRMIPAAAAIFILIIGISAVRNTQIAKMNDQTSMNETAYPQEAEMEYVEETAAAAADIPESAAADEAADMPESEAAYEETADTAASTDKATGSAQQNGVGNKTESAATAPTQELADGGAKETEVKNNNTSSVNDTLEVEKAVLTGISVADPDWKDQGYAYVYHFTTDDGDSIDALLSQSLCDELETRDITIRRKKTYHIVVTPIASDKDAAGDDQTAVCRLEKISE
ncbi:MAG: hypothetical protein PUD03_06305 [Lachnospiraceae bacterium]|nr:hypothetical protein [Lachnospiraceae bacterium]